MTDSNVMAHVSWLEFSIYFNFCRFTALAYTTLDKLWIFFLIGIVLIFIRSSPVDDLIDLLKSGVSTRPFVRLSVRLQTVFFSISI